MNLATLQKNKIIFIFIFGMVGAMLISQGIQYFLQNFLDGFQMTANIKNWVMICSGLGVIIFLKWRF